MTSPLFPAACTHIPVGNSQFTSVGAGDLCNKILVLTLHSREDDGNFVAREISDAHRPTGKGTELHCYCQR